MVARSRGIAFTEVIESGSEPDVRLAVAHTNRGLAYRLKGDNDRALADYDQAIKLHPTYARAYSNRGVIYNDRKDYDRALADYNRAIESDPNFASATATGAVSTAPEAITTAPSPTTTRRSDSTRNALRSSTIAAMPTL